MSETGEPRRRPSPTSRARRIGGRPLPHAQQPAQSEPDREPTPVASTTTRTTAETPPEPKPRPAPQDPQQPQQPQQPRQPQESDQSSGASLRWVPAGLLAIAALTLAVICVFASHGVYWAKPDHSSGARNAKQEQVLAAAKKCFATVNSYDYRKLDGLAAKDAACLTGTFKSQFASYLQKTIIALAPKAKAVQTAQVNKAGVVSVNQDGTQWTTLIYGQLVQSNTSTAKGTPRTDLFGAVVTVDRVGNRYLISKVGYDTGNPFGS
jgi:Mce-associated membrane protein